MTLEIGGPGDTLEVRMGREGVSPEHRMRMEGGLSPQARSGRPT
jgi:hypothetical protein